MYAVLLTFTEDPARFELRPSHREHLAAHRDHGRLLAAGPWGDDTGALLLFSVDGPGELDAVLAADPYYSAPGVTVTVHEWNPVVHSSALDGL